MKKYSVFNLAVILAVAILLTLSFAAADMSGSNMVKNILFPQAEAEEIDNGEAKGDEIGDAAVTATAGAAENSTDGSEANNGETKPAVTFDPLISIITITIVGTLMCVYLFIKNRNNQ